MSLPRREIWAIFALFLVFLLVATLSQERGQEVRSSKEPSTFNAQAAGAKALYLLLEKQGFAVTRQRKDWSHLDPKIGLLLVIEPFHKDRAVQKIEVDHLKKWVEQGGTLLYVASLPERTTNTEDPLAGDVAIRGGSAQPALVAPSLVEDSPYLQNVSTIESTSHIRLSAPPSYQVLLEDDEGALLIHKRLGKGHLLLCAIESLFSNSTLASETHENALLLVNIAHAATSSQRPTISFDEYHHGVGFANSEIQGVGVWSLTPLPLRLFVLLVLALFGFLLYTRNRRFGAIQYLPSPTYRPAIDYLQALGRFWRRTGSADVAFLELYDQTLHDIAVKFGISTESPAQFLAEGVRVAPTLFQKWRDLFERGEQIRAGERIQERELISLAKQIESLRSEASLV
jgi:hypothetical protein